MRRLRVMGHPVHPALTDFPIALLPAAFVFDAIGFFGPPSFWKIGAGCLLAGVVMAAPTALTGLLDLLAIPTEQSRTWDLATWHLCAALGGVSLFLATLLMRPWLEAPVSGRQGWVLGLELLGTLALMAAGWLGGHLVFHHAVGVDRPPPEP